MSTLSRRLLIPVLALLAPLLPAVEKPNIIFIMADDMGYADLGCFGAEKIKTPVIDKMAEEGAKFTSFYTHSVCGPTRSAVLSGSYAMRIAELGNRKGHHPFVHPQEILIPKVLKPAGYISACVGKWDLNGHQSNYSKKIIPNDFEFDYSYGRPSRGHIYENGIKMKESDNDHLTQWYTDAALAFIDKNHEKPFFLYLAHTMPHEPLGATEAFRGKSERGLYGDVIEEFDWNVGRVLNKLKELKIDERTIVIVTSDNGPWPLWTGPEESGSTGPLRGQKTETWEGGVRTPFVIRAPGIVPAGRVVDGMIGDVDMLTTFASWAGATLPEDRILDGKDLVPLMTGQVDETPVTERYYYYDTHLQAVRAGAWKLILKRPKTPQWLSDKGRADKHRGADVEAIPTPELYNLETDIGETTDVAEQNPETVAELLALAEKAREDIGDYNRIGKGARFYDEGPQRPDAKRWLNLKKK